jgi:hypothetical protein
MKIKTIFRFDLFKTQAKQLDSNERQNILVVRNFYLPAFIDENFAYYDSARIYFYSEKDDY